MYNKNYDLKHLPLESQITVINYFKVIENLENIDELKNLSEFLLYNLVCSREIAKQLLIEKLNVCGKKQ
jgi:hypothetical protein